MTNYDKVLAQIEDNKAKIKALTEANNDLFASIPGSSEAGTVITGERFIFEVVPNYRFDTATAQKALSATKFKKITKSVADSTLAKKFLTGDEYQLCQAMVGTKKIVKEVK